MREDTHLHVQYTDDAADSGKLTSWYWLSSHPGAESDEGIEVCFMKTGEKLVDPAISREHGYVHILLEELTARLDPDYVLVERYTSPEGHDPTVLTLLSTEDNSRVVACYVAEKIRSLLQEHLGGSLPIAPGVRRHPAVERCAA